jgi:uncharacterized damage-inducible protein DinB
MTNPLYQEFIDQAIFRLRENTPRVLKCMAELTEEEIWQKPNSVSNSVGNIILHVCGNLRQYAISSLGGTEDTRERQLEFTVSGIYNKKELLDRLLQTVDEAVEQILVADEASLMRPRSVQGFQLSGVGIILHVVEHFSYHSGQIAFWTKYIKDKDLGFYAGLNLNAKNRN